MPKRNYFLLLFTFILSLILTLPIEAKAMKIKVNGINLYYELHGKGNPIVLVAGFLCDHTYWVGMLDALAKNHRVLIFDNRGIGQSDAPTGPYTIDMMADDTLALIDKLGIKNPTVIGQSMGSAITQSLARRFPGKIKNIVLINTFYQLGKIQEIAFAAAGDLQTLKVPMKNWFLTLVPWVFSNEFLSQPNQINNLIRLAEQNPYPQKHIGYVGQLDALRQFNSLLWLNQIQLDTLVIAADEDIIAPPSDADRITHTIGSKAQLKIIPGGHASPIEQPKKVSQLILDFL